MKLKLLLTIEETMAETGDSRSGLYRKFKSGELKAVKVGSRTYVRGEDLMAYIAALPTFHSPKNTQAA